MRTHTNFKIFALSSIFNEGMPLDQVWWMPGERREGLFAKITNPAYSSMISRFVAHLSNFVTVDRSQQKRNWGTLRAWFPKRALTPLSYNLWFLETILRRNRNQFPQNQLGDATLATQYGFELQPIVDEYQRRYKVNILREQFHLEQSRRLCGEYLTQFIRELSEAVHSKNKSLIVESVREITSVYRMGIHSHGRARVKSQLIDGLVMVISPNNSFFFQTGWDMDILRNRDSLLVCRISYGPCSRTIGRYAQHSG